MVEEINSWKIPENFRRCVKVNQSFVLSICREQGFYSRNKSLLLKINLTTEPTENPCWWLPSFDWGRPSEKFRKVGLKRVFIVDVDF